MTKRVIFSHEEGFTLAEIIVTIAIMAAILPALLKVFSETTRNVALSDNRVTAVYLLKFQMAEIERYGFPEVGQNSGEFGEGTNFSWESVIEDVESEEVIGLRKIGVTVTWEHLGKVRSISMHTYMADREIQQQQNQ